MINDVMMRDMRSQREALRQGLSPLRRAAELLPDRSFDRIVISGSGDSYIAAVAVESLYQSRLTTPVQALPALDASRHRHPRAGDLVVIISTSGEVARAIELAHSATSVGALTVGVTAAANSTLARACDLVLLTPEPIDRTIPHSRDYLVTLQALGCLLEQLCGHQLSEIDALVDIVGDTVTASLGRAEEIRSVTAGRRTWFLGAGPDRATAMYGAMKYWEAAGLESWWDDLEEFGHGSQLMARPGDRAVIVAAGRSTGRALEMIPGFQRMGMEVVLVGGSKLAMAGVAHLDTTDALAPEWHPFVAAVPLQALTFVEAERRRLDVSVVLDGQEHGPVYDQVHREWTKLSEIVTFGAEETDATRPGKEGQ